MNRYDAYLQEFKLGRAARERGNLAAAEHHWSRAHILGQPRIGPHLRTHAVLLQLYLHQGRIADAVGQAWRMLLVIPGTWLNRLPSGNSGLSNVSAFRPMSVPPDLEPYMHDTKQGDR